MDYGIKDLTYEQNIQTQERIIPNAYLVASPRILGGDLGVEWGVGNEDWGRVVSFPSQKKRN